MLILQIPHFMRHITISTQKSYPELNPSRSFALFSRVLLLYLLSLHIDNKSAFVKILFFQLAFHLFAVRYGTLASSEAAFKHIPYCDSNVISSSSFSDKDFNQMYSAGVSMLSSHPYRSPFHTGSSIVTVNCSGNSAYSGDCPSSPPTSSSKLLSQNVCV